MRNAHLRSIGLLIVAVLAIVAQNFLKAQSLELQVTLDAQQRPQTAWTVPDGKVFRLQSRPSIFTGAWTELSSNDFSLTQVGSSSQIVDLRPRSRSMFYRLIEVPNSPSEDDAQVYQIGTPVLQDIWVRRKRHLNGSHTPDRVANAQRRLGTHTSRDNLNKYGLSHLVDGR